MNSHFAGEEDTYIYIYSILFYFQSFSVSSLQLPKTAEPIEEPFFAGICLVWPPPWIPVTTRIITCLGSGIPINLHGLHCYREGAVSKVYLCVCVCLFC